MKDLEKDQYEPAPSKKTARKELLELNQIFQNITDGVIVIDKEYNIIRWRMLLRRHPPTDLAARPLESIRRWMKYR